VLAARAARLPERAVNAVVERLMRQDLLAAWGVPHGMRVMGQRSPAGYLREIARYRTEDVAPLVTQDVLLLAGTHDHYVPLHQLGDQINQLTRARSVTARVFTEAEHAHNHCQVGNLGLARDVILGWVGRVSGG
jgi:hypothetical protein